MKLGRNNDSNNNKKTATTIRNSSYLNRLHDKKFTGLRSCRVLQCFGDEVARRLGFSLATQKLVGEALARKYPGHNNPASYTGCKIHLLGYFNPSVNNLLWTRIAVIRHYYWIVYICCGSIVNTLSFITIPKDKGK